MRPRHGALAFTGVASDPPTAIHSLCTAAKGGAAVLEEWIRNVPLPLVERIVADRKVQGTPIWSLASVELLRRKQGTQRAA